MSEETMHTAARRALREFRIDEARGGGLIGIPLTKAMAILDMQVEKENARIKEAAQAVAAAETERQA
jgi:hypothetical protein